MPGENDFSRLELSLPAARRNYRYFRSLLRPSTKLLVLVKANAYGHGAVEFASMMQEKINMKVDTTVIDQEITALEKQLKQSFAVKRKTLEEIEALDPDAKHYKRSKADLDDRLYRMYDKIDDQEQSLIEAKAKKQSIESEKVTGDNIYKILIYFDKFYSLMNEEERRKLMESLIQEIQIYEERQPNGQWLKSITFRLPIIEKDMKISVGDGLDSEQHVES
jgi:site-specific DNA recombinase